MVETELVRSVVALSSKVTTTAVRPAAYVVLPRIRGSHDFSHASPVATEQSCMSLHRFGVTNENAGRLPPVSAPSKAPADVVPIGTSHEAQSVRMPVKYAAGLCLTAYVPDAVSAQLAGIDSSY